MIRTVTTPVFQAALRRLAQEWGDSAEARLSVHPLVDGHWLREVGELWVRAGPESPWRPIARISDVDTARRDVRRFTALQAERRRQSDVHSPAAPR